MAKKVGVILSGCGVFDGAEIHESVITMLELDRRGAEMVLCAPDISQLHVVNHLTGAVVEGASRNVLVEAARIARGVIRDVAHVSADELDALILPGGFGAQQLYDAFILQGQNSYSEALLVGKAIKEVDISDLGFQLTFVDNPDIVNVYTNLLAASQNHLATFLNHINTDTPNLPSTE